MSVGRRALARNTTIATLGVAAGLVVAAAGSLGGPLIGLLVSLAAALGIVVLESLWTSPETAAARARVEQLERQLSDVARRPDMSDQLVRDDIEREQRARRRYGNPHGSA